MASLSGKKSYRSTHKIKDVSYSRDWLLCICGWEGRAYDTVKDTLDWPSHRRNAEPITIEIEKLYQGNYAKTTRSKKEVAA